MVPISLCMHTSITYMAEQFLTHLFFYSFKGPIWRSPITSSSFIPTAHLELPVWVWSLWPRPRHLSSRPSGGCSGSRRTNQCMCIDSTPLEHQRRNCTHIGGGRGRANEDKLIKNLHLFYHEIVLLEIHVLNKSLKNIKLCAFNLLSCG